MENKKNIKVQRNIPRYLLVIESPIPLAMILP